MIKDNSETRKKYDLADRTFRFSQDLLKLCRKIKQDNIVYPMISQLIRSGTSIGANYCEADDAESRPDFKHKIGICKKESREAKHFLRMSAVAVPDMKDHARKLWVEAKELNLIFNSIYKKLKDK